MDVVDRLCPSTLLGWHIAAFTHLAGSLLHTQPLLTFLAGGVCAPYPSENDGRLASLAERICPFCDRCIDKTVSVLSIETDRSGATSDVASCTSQTHPYLADGWGSSVSLLGRE